LNELTAAAFAACELAPSELAPRANKPLVFRDWTLLANSDAAQLPNAASFWWTSDGAFVLAVERIQFVLLTRRSLFVYSVDYDFMAKKAHAASMHTLYHHDIVNIIIRDLYRPVALLLQGVSAEVAAKQMVLVSEAGEHLAVTGLHETSSHGLRRGIKSKTGVSAGNGRRNLETELTHALPQHQPYLQAERGALETESLLGVAAPDIDRRGVEAAFNSMKQLIRSGELAARSSGDAQGTAGLHLVSGQKRR
jgi:hypothetical protein